MTVSNCTRFHCLTLGLLASVLGSPLSAREHAPALKPEVKEIISAYQAVFTSPPKTLPSNTAVDSPLLGNGDFLMTFGGAPQQQRFYLSKNELWLLNRSFKTTDRASCPLSLGYFQLEAPGLKGANYNVSQDVFTATTRGQYRQKDGSGLNLTCRTIATDNLCLIDLEAVGKDQPLRLRMEPNYGRGSSASSTFSDGIGLATRAFSSGVDLPSGVSIAWKVLGGKLKTWPEVTDPIGYHATQNLHLGSEQGRWGFQGSVADLRIYNSNSDGKRPLPKPLFTAFVGKEAKTFDGKTSVDGGKVSLPLTFLTIRCKIKIDAFAEDANYILSGGVWNKATSLILCQGKLRFTVQGRYVQTSDPLPTGEWIDVQAIRDGGCWKIMVNGKQAAIKGTPSTVLPAVGGFVLKAGQHATVVMAMTGLYGDGEDYSAKAVKTLKAIKPRKLPGLIAKHEAWWAQFWSKSFVDIPDKVLEQRYYLSQYVIASASRVYDFPPGIFGWVTTETPLWRGDYHLNYNHVAPFYGLYAANHIEQADPCHAPLLANADQARELCRKSLKVEGIYQYVGIGPKGTLATPLALMQKSNSSYSCVPLMFRWYTTYDLDFAREAYPFVRDVALFWENWLKFENDRYVIYK